MSKSQLKFTFGDALGIGVYGTIGLTLIRDGMLVAGFFFLIFASLFVFFKFLPQKREPY